MGAQVGAQTAGRSLGAWVIQVLAESACSEPGSGVRAVFFMEAEEVRGCQGHTRQGRRGFSGSACRGVEGN